MKDLLKNFKLNESTVSMILGVVVVIIVGGLLINYFKSVNKSGTTSSDNTQVSPTGEAPKPSLSDLPTTYAAEANDSLWSIAEAVYGSGYNWVDIYAANKDVIGPNPSNLFVGTKLNLPKVDPKQATAIKAKTVDYTVVQGDSLSQIAFNLCGDQFEWSTIASDNNLANPRVIEPGQKLTVNCQ